MNIIAYGSLLKKSSLEKTLQREATLQRTTLPGFRRIFNAPFDDYAFLNIEKSSRTSIDVAFFTLNKKELAKFAERESGSDVIECLPGYYAFVWPQISCKELPVLQSYIDVCEAGAQEVGIDLWKGIKKPKVIINDRENPLYP